MIILLIIAMGGTPVIENPGSSMIWLHTRFQWLLQALELGNMKDSRSVLRLPHNNLVESVSGKYMALMVCP